MTKVRTVWWAFLYFTFKINRMLQNPSENKNYFTIAFYNLENLFDTQDDPETLDDDFTEGSYKNWNEKRFQNKVQKLGKVISTIGFDKTKHPPVLIGVAEVENSTVLEALVASKHLQNKNYGFVHFDSPDERGIDNALLYRKDFFKVSHQEAHTLYVTNEVGERDYTRDILHVFGSLQEQPLHILVNHWPSRRQGTQETDYKRLAAAQKNLEIIHAIQSKDPEARIMVMGDFNDDPLSESLQTLTAKTFYNPMEVLLTQYQGSLSHEETWHLFDQILVSHNFLKGHENPFRFESAHIFNPKQIQEYKEAYKGLPFRTYVGKKYLGGYSDHFPVYGVFSLQMP
ncbi:MAG: endonuclease [Flavobacteriaceae bacterium]